MNKYTIILASTLLLSTWHTTNAQDQARTTEVTKGYYSIGDNKAKLPVKSTQAVSGHSTVTIKKGFFAVGDNQKKLAVPPLSIQSAKRPVIRKGYYSIGNNAEKLRK